MLYQPDQVPDSALTAAESLPKELSLDRRFVRSVTRLLAEQKDKAQATFESRFIALLDAQIQQIRLQLSMDLRIQIGRAKRRGGNSSAPVLRLGERQY